MSPIYSMKLFCNNKLNKQMLRKDICEFAFNLGVNKVTFNKKAKYISGSYNYSKKTIFVDGKQSRKEILLTFFHELAHHEASKRKKWLMYHKNAATPLITASTKFKIENKIDKLAKKLWYKYVDVKQWGKYKYGYPVSESKHLTKWLEFSFV